GSSSVPSWVPVDLPRRRQSAASNGFRLTLRGEAIEVGELTLRTGHSAAYGAGFENAQQRWHWLFGTEALDQPIAPELREPMTVRAIHAHDRVADVAELVAASGHAPMLAGGLVKIRGRN